MYNYYTNKSFKDKAQNSRDHAVLTHRLPSNSSNYTRYDWKVWLKTLHNNYSNHKKFYKLSLHCSFSKTKTFTNKPIYTDK